ncbi:MAG: sulfatase-like hydrolase/transferase [Geminicoccaceae bacterium]|nr:sulfatase-like hydrolase/transferase [Geminicoccaceae bacterium]
MGEARPNIVFLFPDQLRWDFVGCYGAAFARTPNIDRLAADGVLYERALAPHPVCIPQRAALLTGCNALTTGVITNNHWLRPDHDACGMPTFATRLAEVGWRTAAIGKMHFIPWDIAEGFEHRVTCEDKRHVHIEDDYHAYLARHGLKKLRGWEEEGYTEHRMAAISSIPHEHQVDVFVGREAARFVDEYDEDRPFMMMVGFAGPHDPYDPPADRARRFDPAAMPPPLPPTPATERLAPELIAAHAGGSSRVDLSTFSDADKRRVRAHYCALIEMIDEQVGAILQALERKGLAENTVVVFASDHGDFVGDFGYLGKSLFFEPSIHVPLIVRRPGAAAGTRVRETVTITDLFATFLALAGIDHASGTDSVVLPGIGLDAGEVRTHVLGATSHGFALDDGRFRLARYADGTATLFDLKEDPRERANLIEASSHAAHRERLDRQLARAVHRAILASNEDRRYPYLTMTPDHPAHRSGWRRPYPWPAHRGSH